MRLALGSSATWIPKHTYSFSSGPWGGSEARELLGLMARSAEQPEYGWLYCRDFSSPGLLISGAEYRFPELLTGQRELPPIVAVGTVASAISLALPLLPMDGTVLVGALVDTVLVGTLDDLRPTCLDGVGLVSTLAGAGLASTLEVTVSTGFRVVAEGTELAVTELAGTSVGTTLG